MSDLERNLTDVATGLERAMRASGTLAAEFTAQACPEGAKVWSRRTGHLASLYQQVKEDLVEAQRQAKARQERDHAKEGLTE